MKKKVLIFVGHPAKDSLCKAIGKKYYEGCLSSGGHAKMVCLSDLKFDSNLQNGYKKRQKLEMDLKEIKKDIFWADYLVFVYPIWWGGMPAKFKGLMDRILLPGFVFKFEKGSLLPKQFLNGKSARIITTRGGSRFFYFGSLSFPGMIFRRFVLNFCGVFLVRETNFYSADHVSEQRAEKIFKKVFRLGQRIGRKH